MLKHDACCSFVFLPLPGTSTVRPRGHHGLASRPPPQRDNGRRQPPNQISGDDLPLIQALAGRRVLNAIHVPRDCAFCSICLKRSSALTGSPQRFAPGDCQEEPWRPNCSRHKAPCREGNHHDAAAKAAAAGGPDHAICRSLEAFLMATCMPSLRPQRADHHNAALLFDPSLLICSSHVIAWELSLWSHAQGQPKSHHCHICIFCDLSCHHHSSQRVTKIAA